MIADALSRDFRFTLSGKDAETWVEGICREAKGYLTRGEEFPRRADREDLDIAIEDWLEVEGRRKLQKGASEMRMGYILAFGPERSEEEHLLAGPCLQQLRENADKIKTAVSDKGKASRKTSILLVRKIEALIPKPTQKPSMTEHFSTGGSSSGRSEKLLPALNPISNNVASCRPDHIHPNGAGVGMGPSNVGKATAQELPSMFPRASDAPNSPRLFTRSSPIRGPSPILGGLDSPIKGRSRPTKRGTTKRYAHSHSSPIAHPTSVQHNDPGEEKSETAQQRHADVDASKWSRSGSPAVKKHAVQPNAAKSKKTPARSKTNTDLLHEPIRTDSSKGNSRKISASPSIRNTTTISSDSSKQDQQQAESSSSRSTEGAHLVEQEQGKPLAAILPATSQKGKNKRSSNSQSNSPSKIHRTQYEMSGALPTDISPPEDVACHDNENVGDQAPNAIPPSDHIQAPQAPPTEHNGDHNGEHSRGELESRQNGPGESLPSTIPIIDLTQSPIRDQVKKEEEEEGPVFGRLLGGRLISQLTTNLHGAVGLTEHIREIVGRTISQSLEEFEHRALGRLDEMRNDLRALEDSRNHS